MEDDPGAIDWATVKTDSRITQWASIADDGISQIGGAAAKEQDPTKWGCAANESPPKDDILRLYLASQISATKQFLHIGYVRDTGVGDTDVDIEFNRVTGDFSCPGGSGRVRSTGDVLISFIFPGGDGDAVVDVYRWESTAGDGSDGDLEKADGHWVHLDTPAVAGATNPGAINDVFFDDSVIAPRTFAELSVDLGVLFTDSLLSCPGLGFVTPHSRASHSLTADLKDILPETPFNLSDCGSLNLKKVDDLGRAMPDVTFGLYQINNDGTKGAPVQLNGANLTCTTNASGICSFTKVPPGTYLVDETNLPPGYSSDPRLPFPVTVTGFALTDLTDQQSEWFVNPRKTGSVVITKYLADGAGNPIDLTEANQAFYSPFILGASFELRQGGLPATKADGVSAASCSLSGLNLTTNSASCTITSVLYGAYVVHETAPAGTAPLVNDQAVTVNDTTPSVSVSFTNRLDPDTVVVKGTSTGVVNAGDQVSFTLTVTNAGEAPALGVVLTDQLSAAISNWATNPAGPPCSIADGALSCNIGTLHPQAQFSVTLTGTSTPAACPGITNQARVTSTNETTQDAANNNSAVVPVTVNCPDVSITKTTSSPTVDAGDAVQFSITVRNAGPGVAKNVSFSDNLPGGVAWSFDGDGPAGCSLDGSTNLYCSFATMLPDAPVVINVKGTTDAADCPSLTNPAITVSASNEPAGATANNTAAAVPITVNCPAIEVTKSGNGPVNAGEKAIFTITVRNAGAGEATGVVVNDALPAGVTWSLGADAPAECAIQGGSLGCTFATLAPEATVTITVEGVTDAGDCPSITNVVVSVTPGNGPGATAGPATVGVNCPDMKVTKTGNGPISAGDPENRAQYTITVTNDGPGVASGVAFNDALPSGVTWAVGTPFPESCALEDNSLSCSWGMFAPGSSTIVVTAATDAGDCPAITNPVSTVTAANEAVATLADNSTTAAQIVINCPDLEISKDADVASVSRGDPIGFSMKVWNNGPGAAFGTTLTDPLPDGFDWDFSAVGSSLPEGGSCSVDDTTNTLSCDLGGLAAGSSEAQPAAIVRVVAAATLLGECGPYRNTASVRSDNGGSAGDSASVTLLCPGVNVVKDADADVVDAGGQIGFTLEVSNAGPGEAKAVVVTDVLPGPFTWAVDTEGSELPEGAECGVAAGVLSCQLGDLGVSDTAAARIHVVALTSLPAGDSGVSPCGPYSNVASAMPANGEGTLSAVVDVDVRCPPGIELTKTGPVQAHVGDTVAYQFTVTNTGYVDLVDVNLVDPNCDGTVVLVSKGDGDALLEIDTSEAPGLQREVWTYRCTRVVRFTDPDPLPNTATVTGTDLDQRKTTDTASWSVDIIHPGISIVKTANPVSISGSGTVTYTYVVTNTGDTPLLDVLVTDDILGPVGAVGRLAPGESITMAKTVDVDVTTPPVNIGTAVGTDPLGLAVSASDDATITVVLGAVLAQPELPRTGAPLQAQTRAALAMIQVGIFLALAGRRRRVIRRAD